VSAGDSGDPARFRDEQAFRVARDSLLAIPCVESPLDQNLFLEAADLYRRARRAGFTVRSASTV